MFFDDKKTIRILSSPIEFIRCENGEEIQNAEFAKKARIIDLYNAWKNGTDVYETIYAKEYTKIYGYEIMKSHVDAIKNAHDSPLIKTPLPCVINCRGRFRLLDGHHRAVRMYLENEPVLLDVRYVSPLWKQLETDLISIYGKQVLYQKIEHPWFDNWPCHRSEKRFDYIFETLQSLNMKCGRHIDIGSCTGRLCREFHRKGWTSYGIDIDERIVRIAEFLNNVFEIRVPYINDDNFMRLVNSGVKWDVITCLSVFHRIMIKEPERVKNIFKILSERSHILFVDGASPDDETCKGFDWNEELYIEWLKNATCKNVEKVCTTEGRTIYKIIN